MKQLSVLLFGCSLLTGCSHGNGEETSLGRPNIIFILTDDQRWDALGYAGNKIIRTPEMDKLAKEVREGYNRTRWYWRYDTPAKYQHSMKGYYRMISEVDDEIGEIRKLLEEKEIADNTVIIFMGDNGYFVGERQLAGKWLMYENSIRVPLMIYDPRAGQHFDIEDMILNIDIASTILDLAGIELPEPYQGFSLMPYVIDGKHDEKRETILIEHLWELPQIPSSEGIRSDRWKYFRYRFIDAPEELYDLDNDPLEIHNLATDPKYDKVLQIFRKELKYRINQYYNAKLLSLIHI